MKEILMLEPIFKEVLWGSDRMKEEYGYPIPSDHTGECWAVSAHKNGDCTILNSTYKGKTLSNLWENHRELFGYLSGDVFPLLTKIISAKEDLSIQVHPDDTYAKEHENGSLGKTECWYILDCDPGSKIVVGHEAKNKEELQQRISAGEWNELINPRPIKKGDFFQIEPGTVHAIKGGTLLLETQQNSDVTYRLYDYDRLSDGKLRELHIDKSIDVIKCPHVEDTSNRYINKNKNYDREDLVSCDYYVVFKLDIHGQADFVQEEPFMIMSVISGQGEIDGTALKKGDHFIIPAEYGTFCLKGDMSLIVSHV